MHVSRAHLHVGRCIFDLIGVFIFSLVSWDVPCDGNLSSLAHLSMRNNISFRGATASWCWSIAHDNHVTSCREKRGWGISIFFFRNSKQQTYITLYSWYASRALWMICIKRSHGVSLPFCVSSAGVAWWLVWSAAGASAWARASCLNGRIMSCILPFSCMLSIHFLYSSNLVWEAWVIWLWAATMIDCVRFVVLRQRKNIIT